MKKLKGSEILKLSLAAIMSVAFSSAFSQGSTVTINGKVGGNTAGLNKVYIMYPAGQDSAYIKDGRFSMSLNITPPVSQVGIVTEYELVNTNVGMGRFKTLFLTSGGTLNVDIEDIQKGMKSARISGIASAVEFEKFEQAQRDLHVAIRNELEPAYGVKKSIDPRDPVDMEYIAEYQKLEATKQADMLEKFVKAYPDSYVSAYQLSNLKSNIGDDARVKQIYDLLSAKNKQSFAGTDVGEYVKSASASIVGKKLPEFSLSKPDGRSFNSGKLKGKYVLLDFWASWCQPCLASIPTLKELYNKYKGDNFDICSISTDKDRAAWLMEVKKQRLPWTQVLDNQDLSLNKFAVEAIPTLYLIDPDGNVVLKQLGLDAAGDNSLQKKLEEIFAKADGGSEPAKGMLPAGGAQGAPPAGVQTNRAEPAKMKN